MSKLSHTYQPNGISCGPTCLFIVKTALLKSIIKIEDILNSLVIGGEEISFEKTKLPTIEEISDMCGTDSIVGTPPDRLEKGLIALDIKYLEYQTQPRPYETLKEAIKAHNVGILRTITKGVPHWIIVDGFDIETNKFNVLDPWLGPIEYTESGLEEIWAVRKYHFFEIIMR